MKFICLINVSTRVWEPVQQFLKKNEMRPYVVHGCVVIAIICSYIDAASCRKNQKFEHGAFLLTSSMVEYMMNGNRWITGRRKRY